VLFLQLGNGGLGRFILALAGSVAEMAHIRPAFCLPRRHEVFDRLVALGCKVVAADAGDDAAGASAYGCRVETLQRNIASALGPSTAAVTIKPHIWAPMLAPLIRRHGVRYLTVVHDARLHPHDRTRLLNGWVLRDARNADLAVTFSAEVADTLAATGAVPRRKLVTLFQPDLTFGAPQPAQDPGPGAAFRVLAFALLHTYDGLLALIGAVELLRSEGLPVALGVIAEAPLGPLRCRLAKLGAEVHGPGIADADMAAVLSRHHAVALLPGGCGWSTDAAIALGAGLPVVGSRGDTLPRHIEDGATGVVADRADAEGFASAIGRLAGDRTLYAGIRANIRRSAWERSMRRFAAHLVALAVDAQPLTEDRAPRAPTWV
jgi:glycosyltransferase involved in cell wall biosynthesis